MRALADRFVLWRPLVNPPQNGIVADRDGQSQEEALARKTTSDVTDQANDFGSAFGLPRVYLRDAW